MKSFFQRVLPKVFPSEPASAPLRPPRAAATAPLGDAPAGRRPAITVAAPVVAALRRPLISASGDVAGFEFRLDDGTLRRLRKQADAQLEAACVSALLVAARLVALEGRIGLARVPAACLVHAAVPKAEPGTWIAVAIDAASPLAPDQQQGVADKGLQLQAAGGKLGWYPACGLGFAPDFLLLQPTGDGVHALMRQVAGLPAAQQAVPVVATDLAHVEDLELALGSGASYACGALAAEVASPAPEKAAGANPPVPPEVQRVAKLLNQLATGEETAVIVGSIKGDIGLSYRMLQRLNSASFAQRGAIASIDQAVLMLGRKELQRWLSLMLVQFAGSRKVASALQEIALWRSRFVELLAVEQGEAEPGQFFTLGLASMLGLILKMSQADVVSTLSLPPLAEQALLKQSGPWHVYLQMAAQVETQSISDAAALADGFSGAAQVLALSDQAWAWAAENSGRGQAAAGREP